MNGLRILGLLTLLIVAAVFCFTLNELEAVKAENQKLSQENEALKIENQALRIEKDGLAVQVDEQLSENEKMRQELILLRQEVARLSVYIVRFNDGSQRLAQASGEEAEVTLSAIVADMGKLAQQRVPSLPLAASLLTAGLATAGFGAYRFLR